MGFRALPQIVLRATKTSKWASLPRFVSTYIAIKQERMVYNLKSTALFYHSTRFTMRHKPHKSKLALFPRNSGELREQFQNCLQKLKLDFGPNQVFDTLQQQTDPDLAYDIFLWTAQQTHYKHTPEIYELMIKILSSGQRFKTMIRLMEDVVAGSCAPNESLFNTIIFQYCQLKMLGPAISVFKKMQNLQDCKPKLTAYNLILHGLLGRFQNFVVSCVHLRSVRSLYNQMIAAGVSPNVVTLNLMIKAYSRALEMDAAIRVFREMKLYGCSPTPFSFDYIIRGLCEKGRVQEALELYDSMIGKNMLPNKRVYNVLVCSAALGGKPQEAYRVLMEMLDKEFLPDFITLRTLVNEHCRNGKEQEALNLLNEVRSRNGFVEEGTFHSLVESFKLRHGALIGLK